MMCNKIESDYDGSLTVQVIPQEFQKKAHIIIDDGHGNYNAYYIDQVEELIIILQRAVDKAKLIEEDLNA